MIERFDWSQVATREAALARPRGRDDANLLASVRSIVDDVRADGWAALVRHAERIDGVEPQAIAVAPFADQARRELPGATLAAFDLAVRNIEAFHRATRPVDIETEPMPGLRVAKRWTPIASAGLYVPGGAAPLFSTLLMLGIPARVAGVERMVVVTPPRKQGGLDPAIALAAEAVGMSEVWAIGGAQAIAALAFSAGEIPAMARICGPGNAWVAAAKALVASLPGGPAIDLPAGPSELLVIADTSANPANVAADLLSQAEHDLEAQVLLVTPDAALVDAVEREISRQIAAIGNDRFAPVRAIRCASLDEAASIANAYAPEHLSLAVDEPDRLLPLCINAGAIFVGHGAAESFGDYLAGSSHVLPTDGAARAVGGVSTLTFMKDTSVQRVSPAAARALAAPAAALARLEGLEAHARAARGATGEGRRVSLAQRLTRPEILALPATDIAAAEKGAPIVGSIKLDANENPYPPLSGGTVNRYPEPQPAALRQRLADLYGVETAQLWVTRGSDDAIDLLCRTFCIPGVDQIAIVEPTFSAYAQFARIQGAGVITARLTDDLAFDADAVLAAIGDAKPKLLFLCTPNNPTGSPIDPADVRRIAKAMPDTLVVADEAYLEFSEAPSLAGEVGGNLLVLRTLSKAYGLAGARVGCLVADPEIIDVTSRASPPYPLPSLSIAAALDSLSAERMPVHRERIARILADRDRLADQLRTVAEIQSVRTGGNFLFVVVADPAGLADRLLAAGIRLRFRPNAAAGGVRITVGTEAENAAMLAVFGLSATAKPARRAEIVRDTKETRIALALDLDRDGPRRIDTGIAFYDHMLDQVASHGGFALTLGCTGDLAIDPHHSVEDIALALGAGLKQALGDKRGIGRFGFALPMDETRAEVLIDLSGRPFSKFEGTFDSDAVGGLPTQMVPHIFRSLADSMGAAIHVSVAGDNDHHKVEGCFKAFGRALRMGLAIGGSDALPSTKGVL